MVIYKEKSKLVSIILEILIAYACWTGNHSQFASFQPARPITFLLDIMLAGYNRQYLPILDTISR